MGDEPPLEGRAGIARTEAFSDAVLAIIMTIMVLELEAPHEAGLAALWRLWPTFFAYVLSYAYIAIYWVNHHRLFSHARIVTSELLWSNIALLFTISFLPFSTAYVGRHLSSAGAAALYLLTLLASALAYYWLQKVILRTGDQSSAARRYHTPTMRKALAAAAAYAAGIALSTVSSGIGLTIAGLVAIFWIVPFGPLDRLFMPRDRRG